jgi:glycosyltransferase involved in cell wall biosynthesis
VSKGFKIFFSCDQYTHGNFADFAPQVDEVVCISDYHADFFAKTYQIHNVNVIDLPVRVWDYDGLNIPKVPNRLIFTSVPDRGLSGLVDVWNKIKPAIPDLSLVITSDYRLWGIGHGALNEQFRVKWLLKEDVQFLGAIPRKQLIEEQLKADILAYTCAYPELFCISCAESQYANTYPVTSDMGALVTTNMGKIVPKEVVEQNFLNNFGDTIVDLLKDRTELEKLQKEVHEKALARFHPDIIKEKWDKIFEEA